MLKRVAAGLAIIAMAFVMFVVRAPAAPSGDYHRTVQAAIADLQDYWSKQFPALYGGTYAPVGSVIPARPSTKIPECQGQHISYAHDVRMNAFYCFKGNYIVYDDQTLFPALARRFGPYAPAVVLSHEWGHAIQDRAGADRQNEPTILIELQADCFAGSWVQRVENGQSRRVKHVPGALDHALASYVTFRDAVGTAPSGAQSHGNAFDRVNAFQTGYENGAAACKPFFDSPPPITESTFSSAQEAASGGNLPADQVVPTTIELLNEFYQQVEPSIPPLTLKQVHTFDTRKGQRPKCGGSALPLSTVRNRVFYCLDDNYLAFDTPVLQRIYDNIGDFGVAALIGNAYATYVQFHQHFPGVQDNTPNAVLAADCYTGAWARAVANGLPSKTRNTTLSLSPGDLDKVIQAFIDYNAERHVSAAADLVFRRVEAFRQGFFGGYGSCAPTFAPGGSTSTTSR